MDSEIVVVTEAVPASRQDSPETGKSLLRWLELFLVLLVSFGNFFLSSLNLFAGGKSYTYSSLNLRWIIPLIQEATALLLLGYVLARRGLRIRDLGLRWSWRDIGSGALLTLAAYAAYVVGYDLVLFFHKLIFSSAARGTSAGEIFGYPSIMMLVFVLVNPFFEELIVRAYLMTEIKALTGSWVLAVLVSAAVQTAYHLYYGSTVAIALGCQFLAFSIFFARTRKATPLVVAHGVFDLIGVVRLF